jgi:hypothetical protein
MVLFVGSMLLVFALILLTVDLGNGFVQRRSIQNAADATALAAVRDLSGDGTCTGDCVTTVNKYSSDNGGPSPLHACSDADPANPTDNKCYAAPYIDKGGVSHPGQIEVRLTKNVQTRFGSVVSGLLKTTGLANFDVSARAVAAVGRAEPPPYTFVSLNSEPTCNHHTLVIRLGGQLTVTKNVYVNSCSNDDGFDLFGPGGNIAAPDIFTHGGWETHDNDTITLHGSATPTCGPGTPNPYSKSPQVPAGTVGCPQTGQPLLTDPFSALPPPALGPPAWCTGCVFPTNITKVKRSGNVATAVTPSTAGLSAGDSITVSGVGFGFDGDYTVQSVVDSTTFTYANTGPNQPFITRKQLTSGVATITTSAPHTLAVNDPVTVSGVPVDPAFATLDTVFNGAFTVTAVPSPTTFQYSRPRPPFTRSVSKEGLDSGVAALTLTADATHQLVLGDIFNTSGLAAVLNGGPPPWTASSVPSATTIKYADSKTMDLPVTNKAVATGTTATLTTSGQHGLSVGDSVTVNTGDSRFDGNFDVINVPANNKFKYTIPAVVANVTNKSVASGVATLTTSTAPPVEVGDTVTVNTGDTRFDGTGNQVVTAVNAGAKTFSYTPGTIATTSWTWSSTTHIVTLTATTPPHDLHSGDTVTISMFGGAKSCMNGTVQVLSSPAPTTTTFSYAVPSACNPGAATGTDNAKATLVTVASQSGSGTVTLVTASIACTPSCGTVTVAGFIPANTTVTPAGTLSATGDVADTATSGSFSPAWVKSTGAFAKNGVGSAAVPAPRTVTSGTVTLPAGTYYGGICIGAADCTGSNCTPPQYSPAMKLNAAVTTTTATTIKVSNNVIPVGDVILIDAERMRVTSIVVGNPSILTVVRGVSGTTADLHDQNAPIYKVDTTPAATVTLDGTYIMAGGGLRVCGSSSLIAPHVLIYNTEDPSTHAINTPGAIDQIAVNTTGDVNIGPQTGGFYQGLTIFQDRNLTVSEDRYGFNHDCDSKSNDQDKTPPDVNETTEWDIALRGAAPHSDPITGASGALGSVSGTMYAPANRALFADAVSGRANLAVVTGCIFIDGGNSTFDFQSNGLFGIGAGLGE